MAGRCATIGWTGALVLVLLRVAVGWHFYSEGVQKLDGKFSAAGFLSNANGPFADYYRSFVPVSHDWQNKLKVQPNPDAKEPGDSEAFAGEKAYAAWGNQIVADWRDVVSQLGTAKMPRVSEVEQAAAEELLGRQIAVLGTYLESIEPEIQEYHHELYDRLGELEQEAPRGSVPFIDERVAEKSAEVSAMPWSWFNAVAAQERVFVEELADIIANEDLTQTDAAGLLSERFFPQGDLPRINLAVTCLTIGAGLMLMLGLGTRIAALAAAGFLLSVMSTQPPWDPAVTEQAKLYFGYQLVEVAALLVTMVIGSGRWLGLDGTLYRLLFGRRVD